MLRDRPPPTAEAEFADWYRRVAPKIARYVTGMTSDKELGADIAAESCARVLARWDRLTDQADQPDGWAFRVAINLVRREWRSRKRAWAAKTDVNGPHEDVTVDIDLWRAVARLPKRQREIVTLRYVSDLTERQISTVLGVSEGAVSASLAKARTNLRRQLEEG